MSSCADLRRGVKNGEPKTRLCLGHWERKEESKSLEVACSHYHLCWLQALILFTAQTLDLKQNEAWGACVEPTNKEVH